MDAQEGGGAAEAVEERLGRPEAGEAVGVEEVDCGREDAQHAEGEGVAREGEGGGGEEEAVVHPHGGVDRLQRAQGTNGNSALPVLSSNMQRNRICFSQISPNSIIKHYDCELCYSCICFICHNKLQ